MEVERIPLWGLVLRLGPELVVEELWSVVVVEELWLVVVGSSLKEAGQWLWAPRLSLPVRLWAQQQWRWDPPVRLWSSVGRPAPPGCGRCRWRRQGLRPGPQAWPP